MLKLPFRLLLVIITRVMAVSFLLLLTSNTLVAHTNISINNQKADSSTINAPKHIFEQLQAGYNWSIGKDGGALLLFGEATNRTDITLNTKLRRDGNNLFVPQMGNSDTEGSLYVSSYYKQNNTSAWGKASYTNCLTGGIRFNETSDLNIVGPYVMGDTAHVAPLKQDFYSFDAGASHLFLENWLLASSFHYNATFAYRTVDPRPRNLATWLEAEISTGYKFNNYTIALTGGIGRYKQNNSVTFLSELGVSHEYHFLGLGSDYYRFRGDNTSLFYRGISYSGKLGFVPNQLYAKGIFVNATWRVFTIDRIIRNLNNLPLTHLQNHNLRTTLGYRNSLVAPLNWAIALYGQAAMLRGTTRIFGESTGNIYPFLLEQKNYTLNNYELGIKAFLRSNHNTSLNWGIEGNIGYQQYSEKLLPVGTKQYSHITLSAQPNLFFKHSNWQWFASPLFGMHIAIGKPQLILAEQTEPIIGYHEQLTTSFKLVSATQLQYGFMIGGGYRLSSKYSIYIKLSAEQLASGKARSNHVNALIGLTF